MVPFSFADETFEATASGALFWPQRQALLVADLHLEKASWFARLGQFLPPYDSHATLTDLSAEVERSGATRLYCLGDSFHDAFGCDRLPADARELLTELTSRLDWIWIVGNHDPGSSDHCGGRIRGRSRIRRNHPPSRGGSRRDAAGDIRPLSPQASAEPQGPQGFKALLRPVSDQADHARIRIADRRAGRTSS